MLELKKVCKNYQSQNGQKHGAVCDVTLSLEDRRIYALVGESGCGKSTLSRLLLGLERPSNGQVLLDGQPISRKGKENRRNITKAIQLVLQDGKSAMDPHFTVYQTIAEPTRNVLRLPKQQEREKVLKLLERMELPPTAAGKKANELSGGQQKWVCIARALSISPRYIIFDESISGLDVILRKNILELLRKVQQEEQCSYLFITHEIEAALYLADEVCVMQKGKIVEQCTWNGDLTTFTHPYSKQLLTAAHLI